MNEEKRVLFADEVGPTWKTHLCGVVDILKGRVTGHHGSQVGQGTDSIEPALCVVWFGALKKLNHCKDRWRYRSISLSWNLCANNDVHEAETHRSSQTQHWLYTGCRPTSWQTWTSPFCLHDRNHLECCKTQTDWNASSQEQLSRRGFVFKRGACLLASEPWNDLSHTRGHRALDCNRRRGEGQQRWRPPREIKLQNKTWWCLSVIENISSFENLVVIIYLFFNKLNVFQHI